jgi:hypothetical protein
MEEEEEECMYVMASMGTLLLIYVPKTFHYFGYSFTSETVIPEAFWFRTKNCKWMIR